MSDEQATIGQLMAELAELRQEINSLKSASSATTSANDKLALTEQANITSRRRMLKKLGAGAMLTGLVATAGLASQTQTAHAEVFNNYAPNVGAIIMPAGGSVSGTIPSSRKFGLLATANMALDLTTLTGGPAMAAIFGQGKSGLAGVLGTSDSNIGVYARSSTNDALHALSDTGKAVFARSTKGDYALHAIADKTQGTAILAESANGRGVVATSTVATAVTGDSSSGIGVFGDSTSSVGVFGASNRDIGVKATSITGAPFQIVPGEQPTTGGTGIGRMYINTDGGLHVYTSSGWRAVAYMGD